MVFFHGVLTVCSLWLDAMTCLSRFLSLLAVCGCATIYVRFHEHREARDDVSSSREPILWNSGRRTPS